MYLAKMALPLCLIGVTSFLTGGCTSSIEDNEPQNSPSQNNVDQKNTAKINPDTEKPTQNNPKSPSPYSLIKADNALLDAINKANNDIVEQLINNRGSIYDEVLTDAVEEVAVASADMASNEESASYSQTNLIEKDVDEPDFVKQNARYIFLYGSNNDANQNDNAIKIYDKKANQNQQVNSNTLINSVLQPIGYLDISRAVDSQNNTLEGMFLTKNKLYAISRPYYNDTESKIGIHSYAIDNIESPKLTNTTTITGQLEQPRKLNDSLFLVTENSLNVDQGIDCDEGLSRIMRMAKWNFNTKGAISQCQAKYRLSAEDLLERMPYDINGKKIKPSDCYISPADRDNNIYPHNLTLIHKLNLDGDNVDNKHQTICIATNTDGFYMSDKSIYFASTNHNPPAYDYMDEPNSPDIEFSNVDVVPNMMTSNIHKFDLTSGDINYVGTGRVDGTINSEVPSFSMNEYQGVLRIATSGYGEDGVKNMLHTLRESKDKLELITLASLPNKENPKPIGKPNEQIKGVRFMGDQGYIVTFKNADPLYKIDLADPANPKMMGELEMPGYSAYLHKVNDDYLMGIGYTVNEWAQPTGIQTTLFDVTGVPKIVSQDTVAIKDDDFQPEFKLMIDTDSKALSTVYNNGIFRLTIPYFQETVSDDEDSLITQTKALEYEINPKTAEFTNCYRRDGQKLATSIYDQPRFRALIDGDDLYYTTDDGTINQYEWGKP